MPDTGSAVAVAVVVVGLVALVVSAALWVLRRHNPLASKGDTTLDLLDSRPSSGGVSEDEESTLTPREPDEFFVIDLENASPSPAPVPRRRSRVLSTQDSNSGAILSLAIEPALTGILGVVLERRLRPNNDAEIVVTRLLPGHSAWLSDLVMVDDEVISIAGKPLACCETIEEVRHIFGKANADACQHGNDVIFVIRRRSD